MIHTADGAEVIRLLERVAQYPERYLELTICAPFIGESLVKTIVRLVNGTRRARCVLRVVTSRACASEIVRHAPQAGSFVIPRQRLHAKVYIAIARRPTESEAIVTSANLTPGGTVHNVELGIRAVSKTDAGRRLLDEVHHFVRRVAV
jgi:hypothetical protein